MPPQNLPRKIVGNLSNLQLVLRSLLEFCLQFSTATEVEFMCDCKFIVKEERKYFIQFMAVVDTFDILETPIIELIGNAFSNEAEDSVI